MRLFILVHNSDRETTIYGVTADATAARVWATSEPFTGDNKVVFCELDKFGRLDPAKQAEIDALYKAPTPGTK
jgi:hypothetical protein